jgi:crotonobetainyl-CoA:carnitine CoA-transferase CaiB-like acyl-CoA transferase
MSNNKIFAGLNVIELAGVLSGPSAGLFFAELGANVLKVENPRTGGDVTRKWKIPGEQGPESAYYWSVNFGKKIVFIDLTTDKGLQELYELVRAADIIITNYKHNDDKKLKVDDRSLSKVNPNLIYASISGFGQGSARTAYDLILQAESGFMSMNGTSEQESLKMPVALIDLIAGHQLKEAILIALLQRNKTGKGCRITVSLFESAIASLANQATNWLIANHLPKAAGSLHPNIAPYGEIFTTKDGHKITFAIGDHRHFEALCKIAGRGDLASDTKFADNTSRVHNRLILYKELDKAIAKMAFDELHAACLQSGVPMGKIRNLSEVFELPEAKTMLKEFSQGEQTLTSVSSIAFKISDHE